VSSPESTSQGANRRIRASQDVQVDSKKAGRFSLARQFLLSWCGAQSGGGQEAQRPCSGNRLRPAVDAELAIDVAGVGLDCVR